MPSAAAQRFGAISGRNFVWVMRKDSYGLSCSSAVLKHTCFWPGETPMIGYMGEAPPERRSIFKLAVY